MVCYLIGSYDENILKQVIALFLRSKLKISGVNNGSSGEFVSEEQLG